MSATPNEDALNTNIRFNKTLVLEGYLPVSRNDTDEEARAACPEGFFTMEFRRLDNPAYRIITSFITSGKNKNGDYMQARFEQVSLATPKLSTRGPLQRLMSIFSRAANAPTQPETARNIMTISEAMGIYDETGHFPLGTPASREYTDLSIALYEDLCNSDHEKNAAFFIDPDKIANGYVGLRGHINPARPHHKSTNTEDGNLDIDRLVDNTMLLMNNSRTIHLMIPTAPHESQGVYIKAESTYGLGKQPDSVIQNVPLSVFTASRHDVIAQHVKGQCVTRSPEMGPL